MSDYEQVMTSKLKLKNDCAIKKKKRKDKGKEKKFLEQVDRAMDQRASESSGELKMTKAELAFLKQQETLQKQRILEKASMTHKQRVEEFNRKLDGLTEHFDIPKVSWTK